MIVNLGEEYLPRRLKDGRNSVSAWMEGSSLGWTGRAWAELDVYFTLREAFEWAELQLLQFEGGRSGCSRRFDGLGIALRALFCLSRTLHEFVEVSTFVKTQTLLALAFAEPNL
ncbi:hypothetical protein L3X38_017967 [Prunus dulcis]|uniref:Uncharacterized protein n=1 Tax=Prunus dulcis TaxID=3755 RepID=A0AAD4ZAA8_PRUDU|nr:hypothetical protein L3X38_017967 [Prunus dulcis]